MKDLRKYPRFTTNLEVQFLDRSEAKGTMIDASREGALIILSSKLKAVNSFISFSVFLPKKDDFDEEGNPLIEKIKMIAKVVHHTKYKGDDAMGIQFLELESKDLSKWLSLLGKIKEDQEVLTLRTIDESEPPHDYAGFTIRFKSRSKLKNFFPKKLSEPLFISTKVEKNIGDMVQITLIHPETEDLLHFLAVVEGFGIHPEKPNKTALFCKFFKLTPKLKQAIENFV